MNKILYNLSIKIESLTVFRALTQDPVISALSNFLHSMDNEIFESVSAYSEFVSSLYKSGNSNLSKYIKEAVLYDSNFYIRSVASGKEISQKLQSALYEELCILEEIAALTPEDLRCGIKWDGFLPGWESERIDLTEMYLERLSNIGKYGYGIYSRYHMFYVNKNHEIIPVRNPDRVKLSDLIGYQREKKVIIDNTLALLSGKPASNILLTGDAGTGKSSTIKAVANEYYDQGLRILEIRKEQLHELPAILDELNENPLKFIIFIDDLSFVRDDDNFSTLKAILEGSVSAKASNIVIYATSNRRHLVKESFSDRDGDDVHVNDTMQELVSLSERFGIRITFSKPSKDTYLDIVKHLADANGIEYSDEKIMLAAEQFALNKSSRSARAAKQFIDVLLSSTENKLI